MDGDWLNRAGILAEAVSFFLIAPEIIGRERLRRVENALARWGETNLRGRWKLWTRGRVIPFLPGLSSKGSESLLADAALALSALAATWLFLLAAQLTRVSALVYGAWAFSLSLMLGVAGIVLIQVRGSNAVFRYAGYTLGTIALPAAWTLAALSTGIFSVMRSALHLALKLLRGEDSLRALVFGNGVLLLFGGMAAQFAATF